MLDFIATFTLLLRKPAFEPVAKLCLLLVHCEAAANPHIGSKAYKHTIMSKFEIRKRSQSEITILDIYGELDAHTAPILEKELQQLIENNYVHIVVNGSGLEYISSAGLGVFMAYIEDIRSQDGDIKISSLKPKVYNVFDLLGFPTLYEIVENEEEAVTRFK